jgi:hypothetical protein
VSTDSGAEGAVAGSGEFLEGRALDMERWCLSKVGFGGGSGKAIF